MRKKNVRAPEIVKIIAKCGACEKELDVDKGYFQAESDGMSCPGCDGSRRQLTCLCGGGSITKTFEFRCIHCNYYNSIYID